MYYLDKNKNTKYKYSMSSTMKKMLRNTRKKYIINLTLVICVETLIIGNFHLPLYMYLRVCVGINKTILRKLHMNLC